MANPTLRQILDAYKNASPDEKREFDTLLRKAGGAKDAKDEGSSKRDRSRFDARGDFRRLFPDIKKTGEEAIEAIVGQVGEIQGAMASLTAEIKENRLQSEEFFRAGIDKRYYDMSSAISVAADTSFRLTGNLEAQGRAIRGLRQNFSQFALASKEMKDSVAQMATGLAAAGVDTNTYAEIVESATMGFGQSKGALEDMTAALMATSREFAIAPAKMIQDFNSFQKEFAYSADKTMDVFVKLQKMSRTTGVSFNSLTTAFGGTMDEFAGSAQKAGALNQILGQSVFNSIDLLNKSEEERAETIREGIIKRFGTNINNIQKFELRALSKTLGMSIDDTRKFLSGKPTELKDELKKIEEKDPIKIQSQTLADEMGQLTKGIRAYRRPLENTLIDLNNSFRQGFKAVDKFREGMDNFANSAGYTFLEQLGLVRRMSGDVEYTRSSRRLRAGFESIGKKGGVEAAALADGTSPLSGPIRGFLNFAGGMINTLVGVTESGAGGARKGFVEALNAGTAAGQKPTTKPTTTVSAIDTLMPSELPSDVYTVATKLAKVTADTINFVFDSFVVDGQDRGRVVASARLADSSNA